MDNSINLRHMFFVSSSNGFLIDRREEKLSVVLNVSDGNDIKFNVSSVVCVSNLPDVVLLDLA